MTPTAPVANPLRDSAFLRSCRRESVPYTPVWFMRQAGRSLPEYRRIREGVPMLESCMRPELITEITLQPVRRHGVDAAILFSDIVVPLKAIGVDVEIVPGVGPVIAKPIQTRNDLDTLRPLEADDVSFVSQAIRDLVTELGATPLIGFAGAPYTLASYLIEGGPSKSHERTKALMYAEPELWDALLGRSGRHHDGVPPVQVRAGAAAIQLFDSWAGELAPVDYRRRVLPHSAAVLSALGSLAVPRIHFGVGTGEMLDAMGEAGADVVGVDWRVPLDDAARRVGPGRALQGNLDPAVVFAPWHVVAAATRDVLVAGQAAEGHVFNLGHGVLPTTNPDVLTRVVDLVHEVSRR